jgi:AmiR/NasT family two-component response regulator
MPTPSDSAPIAELTAIRARVENLQAALRTCRTIGIAVGIVMAEHKMTAEDAFQVLVRSSQLRHRKLRDIARHIVSTGVVPRP